MQEGDEPPEDPVALLEELPRLAAELERLIAAINITNASSRLTDGQTLTAALARRDSIAVRQNVLRAAADSVAQT